MFDLEQRLSVSDMAKEQFEKAYELVCKIVGETDRLQAFEEAKSLLNAFPEQKNACDTSGRITSEIA